MNLPEAHHKIVEAWVDAFNKADAVAISSLFSEGAKNHIILEKAVEGRPAIQKMFEHEFETAHMFCIANEIAGESNWATLKWKDPNGLEGQSYFEFENGEISFHRGFWDKQSFLRYYSDKNQTGH